MAHFAEIDENLIVKRVIVAEQEFIDSGAVGDSEKWIQTSYNTSGGKHKLGGTPLRKNYAGIGYKYDPNLDAFIPPKTYPSWKLNKETCLWEAPILLPKKGHWKWNEEKLNWEELK